MSAFMVIDHFAWFSTLFVLNYTIRQFCGRCNIKRILYSHANEFFWGLSMVRDGPVEKLWAPGVVGNFRAARIFFRYQIPCINFF